MIFKIKKELKPNVVHIEDNWRVFKGDNDLCNGDLILIADTQQYYKIQATMYYKYGFEYKLQFISSDVSFNFSDIYDTLPKGTRYKIVTGDKIPQ